MKTGLVFVSILLFLLLVIPSFQAASGQASVIAAGETASIDVDRDGKINIFDLLSILRQISGEEPATEYSDLDGNGKTNIFDLIEFLSLFREKNEPFEIAASIGSHLLTEPVVYSHSRFGGTTEVKDTYQICNNKRIARAELILDGDTVSGATGITPILLTADPDTLQFDGIFYYTEPKSWKINAWDLFGNCASDSGSSEFVILSPNIVVDFSVPYVGDEITFPLILHGATQRFGIEINYPSYMFFEIDLNPAKEDSVVYQDIGGLTEQIINQVTADASKYHEVPIYAGAAYSGKTGLIANRLLIINPQNFNSWAKIVPLDSNSKLPLQLGYSAWKQEHYGLMNNLNYIYDQDVYESMQNW